MASNESGGEKASGLEIGPLAFWGFKVGSFIGVVRRDTRDTRRCYKCDKEGHLSFNCPRNKKR